MQFRVVAAGAPSLRYQWTKNGNITRVTKANYTTPPATLGDNGLLFSVTVTNVPGSVTSRAAKLTVTSASGP